MKRRAHPATTTALHSNPHQHLSVSAPQKPSPSTTPIVTLNTPFPSTKFHSNRSCRLTSTCANHSSRSCRLTSTCAPSLGFGVVGSRDFFLPSEPVEDLLPLAAGPAAFATANACSRILRAISCCTCTYFPYLAALSESMAKWRWYCRMVHPVLPDVSSSRPSVFFFFFGPVGTPDWEERGGNVGKNCVVR